jgi:hypothetical protein
MPESEEPETRYPMSYRQTPMEYDGAGLPTKLREDAVIPIEDLSEDRGLQSSIEAMINRFKP